VTGDWRKLHNDELHNLYPLLSTIRMIKEDEMGRARSTHEENGDCGGKPEGPRPLGRPRRRWLDNIKMNVRQDGAVYLAQDRDQWRALVYTVMNLWGP
jgi:hypothetical protein